MPDRPLRIALKRLENGDGLALPAPQSAFAAGADLCAAVPEQSPLVLAPGDWAAVPCGFAMALPEGFEAQVRPRSGLALRHGITVLNAPGTVDADYRGEIRVLLINHGKEAFAIRRGDRIAQLVVARVQALEFFQTDVLDETTRGAGGFGSTGHGSVGDGNGANGGRNGTD